ncbi:MAG TPA: murein biosynthesis integral membrane protein MurJ [Spirochaetota bacterium]|nr:murein biosynthesis integral membrane protein MurJ [Spirochaetota bacterium]
MSRTEPENNAKTSSMERMSHSLLIGTGIFLSRIMGFVRQRIFGYYFGISDAADVFNSAFRIPNFLQNLFGEGALSASFIPVYARLRAEGRNKDALKVANTVLSLLTLAVSIIVAAGIMFSPLLVTLIAPGFTGDKKEYTILLVRILFPGAGLLVLSAWCLGVLNSHRKFFLSYAAPVIWNICIIIALVFFGRRFCSYTLAVYIAWGSVAGSALQFIIQLPAVLRLTGSIKPELDSGNESVKKVITNFFPAFVSRGVVQISAFIDSIIASLIGSGAVAVVACAQTIYTLPVSLFGMAVTAAELPAMSSATGSREEIASTLRMRLEKSLVRIAFFIVPSAAAFFAFGDIITAALYMTGRFDSTGVFFVWLTLGGASVGLLASTFARLVSSAFYALHDTKTPFRFALIRVITAAGLSFVFSVKVPPLLGLDSVYGTAGLTLASGIAGWVEFYLLKRSLVSVIGEFHVEKMLMFKLWSAALAGIACGWGVKIILGFYTHFHPAINALLILGVFGSIYILLLFMMNNNESKAIIGRLKYLIGL